MPTNIELDLELKKLKEKVDNLSIDLYRRGDYLTNDVDKMIQIPKVDKNFKDRSNNDVYVYAILCACIVALTITCWIGAYNFKTVEMGYSQETVIGLDRRE